MTRGEPVDSGRDASSAGSAKEIRNALSVDVEDYFHVSALAESIDRRSWSDMEYRAEANTQKLLELFAEFNVTGTFFILGWVARRSPALVREIHAAGHEVASHGMSHELIYRQSRRDFHAETLESKCLLEDTIGSEVCGYRAASWSITRESLWALDTIRELGFKYDSSVFPVRHDRYGIPGGLQYPGRMQTPSGDSIVEFPPSTVDLAGVRVPVGGGGYFRLLPLWLTRMGLRRINAVHGQPFMFYLHPWEVDPGQPRVPASWLSTFRHYTNLAKTESRLHEVLSEFRLTTARAVLQDAGLLTS